MRLLEEVLLVQSVVLLNDSAVSEQSSAFMADKSNADQLFAFAGIGVSTLAVVVAVVL